MRLMVGRSPSAAYSVAVQSRLDTCELLLDRLRCANDAEQLRILDEHFSNDTNRRKRRRSEISEAPLPDTPRSDGSSDDEMIANEISVDVDGRICFYGTTSLYHLKPDQSTMPRITLPGEASDMIFASPQEVTPPSHLLDSPSDFLRPREQPDIKSCFNIDISSEICNELLDTYWCWSHNIRFILCRKIFMRTYWFHKPLSQFYANYLTIFFQETCCCRDLM